MSEPLALFGAVVAAHALGVASPGPDFAVVIRQTLAHGRRTGLLTAIGIGTGICFHVAWGMFGLGWALQELPWLLDVLRYGGAAFLLWMGLNALRAQPAPSPPATVDAGPSAPGSGAALRAWLIGLLTNLLNVKAMLFFVALCSSVLAAGASPTLRLTMGLWLVLATAAWFSFVALTVGHPAIRRRLAERAHLIDRAMGAVLIAIAAGIVVAA